jgi:hypothetical protein
MMVTAMGGNSILIPEVVGTISYQKNCSISLSLPCVLVVSSFASDEPVQLLLEAARALPHVTFFFTGDHRNFIALTDQVAPNVVLLGYLDRDTYLTYVQETTAILTLSTRSHIMQMAAEEALCMHRPLITNHSPILEEVFQKGAVFTTLDLDTLCSAITRAISRSDSLSAEMAELARERQTRLAGVVSQISANARQP